MSQIQVRDERGAAIPLVNVRLSLGTQSSDDAYDDRFTDLAGNTSWPNPLPSPTGYTLYVNERNVQPQFGSLARFVPSLADDIAIVLPSVQSYLSRLTSIDRERHRCVNEKGQRVFLRGTSDFLLYKRFLDGQDVDAVLTQRRELGGNLLRVMGMFESLGGFRPQDYGDRYYDRIAEFLALCANYGQYVLWTACAATSGIMPNGDDVMRHIGRTVDACTRSTNALFSPVNEQHQHNNSIDRDRFYGEYVQSGKMEWLLYDTGSFGADLPCDPPLGKFAVLHTRRDYPALVKDGCIVDHPNYVNNGIEVGLDEPARFGTTDDPSGNGSVQQARDAAGTAAQTALFWIAHSLQGEKGELFTGNTLDCMRAALSAVREGV